MLIMADDYVGSKVVEYLCEQKETIDVFIYDLQDRGGYNEQMLRAVREANPQAEIFSNQEIQDREIQKKIREQGIDLGILAWWPYIIDEAMISMTRRGFVNTHPGFLPFNRGKHPYFWSIVDQTPFGVTLHYVDKDIDSGAIIAQKEIPVEWEDTGESLYLLSRELILELFREYFPQIKEGTAPTLPKSAENGTFHYGKELEPVCSVNLDQCYTARRLFNILRGRMFRGQGECTFSEGEETYRVSIKIEKISRGGQPSNRRGK